MARLAIENERLVLLTDNEPRLTKGILRVSLISEAGFKLSENQDKFVLTDRISTETALEYTVGLLDTEQISFTMDKKCSEILKSIQNHVQQFKEALRKGSDIKTNKNLGSLSPPGFTKPLLDAQQRAVSLHIQMPYSADFSVPGSGKTWIGYATYSYFKNQGLVKRLLIVGPISSFQTWEEEYSVIFGQKPRISQIRGTLKERKARYSNFEKSEILIVSYHSLANDKDLVENMLRKDAFMVILDESHNVKQPEAKRTNAALEISPLCKRRLILSGTPIPRSIDDLYTQFAFLDPNNDVLGGAGNFSEMIEQDESLDIVKRRIAPFYYRIRKSDFTPTLRDPLFDKEYINMATGQIKDARGNSISTVRGAPNQESIYYGIEGRIFRELQREKEMTFVELMQLQKWQKGRLMRLLEVASNPSLLMDADLDLGIAKISSTDLPIYKLIENYSKLSETPVKIQRTIQIASELLAKSSDQKIVIWTSFVRNISELSRRLEDYGVAIVHGKIPKNEEENKYFHRIGEVKKFKNNPDCRVLIANPASLAESVSLHKNEKGDPVCDTAIYLDRTFNGAHYMQSLDRIHRVGLLPDKTVRYILLLSEDSIDQDVDESLEEKISNLKQFLNDDIQRFSLETSYDDITGGMAERQDYERVIGRIRKHSEQGKFD